MTIKELRRAWHTPEIAGMLWSIVLTYLSFLVKPFVVMNLWNWFVSSVIHAAEISYWQALGFLMLVYVIQLRGDVSTDENWERLFMVLEVLLPAHADGKVTQAIRDGKGDNWKGELVRAFGRLVVYALILVFGWGLHTFFA